jgi:hypothetical protein
LQGDTKRQEVNIGRKKPIPHELADECMAPSEVIARAVIYAQA